MKKERNAQNSINVGLCKRMYGSNIESLPTYSSGADVQISKRGVYAPGTTNRLITIKGSPRAVKSALYLVQQKIQEKQEERARSGRN